MKKNEDSKPKNRSFLFWRKSKTQTENEIMNEQRKRNEQNDEIRRTTKSKRTSNSQSELAK